MVGFKEASARAKPSGQGISTLALSVLSVVVLVVVMPVVMGGTITLAVYLAGESLNASTPDDFNTGVGYNEPFENCTSLQNPSSASTSTVAMGGANWTGLGSPSCATNSGQISQQTKSDGVIEVRFPAGVLVSEDTVSRFAYEVISTNYCDTNSTCNFGWVIDWELRINGSAVFGDSDHKSDQRRRETVGSSAHYYAYIELNYSLSAFDEIALREEMAKCGANRTSAGSCNATLRFDSIKPTSSSSMVCNPFECSGGSRHRFLTYDTRADTSGLLLRGSTYVLGSILALMALAATPVWSPMASWTAKEIKGGRGSI